MSLPRRTFPMIAREHGQSYVETVVMLPVLLAIFLGLYYFHDLVHTRMRAVEAARYVTWQGVWHVRENNSNRQMKNNARLVQELQRVGLGAGLKEVSGGASAQNRRSLIRYSGDLSGAGPTTTPPQLITDLFGGDNSVLSSASGQLNGLLSALGPLFSITGDASFFVQQFFAVNTDWRDENDGAVYTAKVGYRFKGAGFFASLPGIQITEFSSLLTHPLNIKRSADQTELDELIGTGALFRCSGSDLGHIYGLWLFPGDPFGGTLGSTVGTILNGGKCFFTQIGSLTSGLDSVFGSQLGFKLPDGTLKEFPERANP